MSKKKKEQLGKGLRALLTKIDEVDTTPQQKEKVVTKLSKSIAEIEIEKIVPNPYQPRKEFDEDKLLQLVQSITAIGLIQPITLRRVEEGKYQLISGERRWRASKLAGLKTVPAYIRLADDQGMLEMALVENIQRSDLNALEVALSYQRLIDECKLGHEVLAQRVGKKRSTVTNYTRLLKLPPDIQEGLKNDKISMGHARALLSVDDPSIQLDTYRSILAGNLSVRATEKKVKSLRDGSPTTDSKKPNSAVNLHPEVLKIKDRLSHKLRTKVDIARNNKGAGKIVIHFSSDDEFNDIIDSIED